MLCGAMLCYAMLCYAMLCYAMLCYAMLCYAASYYICQALLCANREYEDGMEELAPVSVLDVVMALQRQGAIGQFKNSR